jgi:hypothetical protein
MKSSSVAHLSTKQLQRALSLRIRIDSYEQELQSVIGAGSSGLDAGASVAKPGRKRKYRMSRAGRARIARAARARWRKAKRAGRNSL